MKKFEIILPIFKGFYGSIFEDAETSQIEYENGNRSEENKPPLNYDSFIFETKEYYINCCKSIVNNTLQALNDEIDSNIKLDFIRLESPKYYNFDTDKIICNIELDLNKIINLLIKSNNRFSRYLTDNFSSRPGFISFMSVNPSEWREKIKKASQNEFSLEISYSIDFLLKDLLTDNEIQDIETEAYYNNHLEYIISE